MATITFLAVLGLCVQVIFAGSVRIVPPNPLLDAQCVHTEGSAVVPMPDAMCDVQHYIMCENGKADTIGDCDFKYWFNNVTKWCQPITNISEITLPKGCKALAEKAPPKRCGEDGATKIADPESCRFFKLCTNSGEYRMQCPAKSYYIAEFSKCMALTEPYVREIPTDARDECDRLEALYTTTTRSPTART